MSGCAAGASLRSDFDACRGDAACVQQMEQVRASTVAATKAATSDGLIPTFAGCIASLIAGLIGGHRISKKAG